MARLLCLLLLVLSSFVVESGELPYKYIHITTDEVQVTASTPITDKLLKRQRFIESTNNNDAISICGATGIAQFMPDTWNWLKKVKILPEYYDIHNKRHQIEAQRRYMNYLYNYDYGAPKEISKLTLAVAAYNCGPGRVMEAIKTDPLNWDDHIPKDTQDYLYNILN